MQATARVRVSTVLGGLLIILLAGCFTTPGRAKALDPVFEVAASPVEGLIDVSSMTHQVALFSREPLQFTKLLTSEDLRVKTRQSIHAWWAPPLAFSPDGRDLVAAGVDGRLVSWEVVSGRVNFSCNIEGRPIDVQFLANGHQFITVGSAVTKWSSKSGKPDGYDQADADRGAQVCGKRAPVTQQQRPASDKRAGGVQGCVRSKQAWDFVACDVSDDASEGSRDDAKQDRQKRGRVALQRGLSSRNTEQSQPQCIRNVQ